MPDRRTPDRRAAEPRRPLRLPAPSTWLLLLAVGLYELVSPVEAWWRGLAPDLPGPAPLALALAGVLFGLVFRHVRMGLLSGLVAAVLWIATRPTASDPGALTTVVLFAANLVWIGFLPTRAALSWRWLVAGLVLLVQALTFDRWAPLATERLASLGPRFDADPVPWTAALLATALLSWLLRSALGRGRLELGAVWVCVSVGVFLVSASGPVGRHELHRWLAPALVLLAITEASYRLAYTDELTGLPARRALNDALARLRGDYALAVVDIDRFKSFNDRHGHDVGDQVLRRVASELRTVAGAEAYRLGGEEFALVFARTSAADAEAALEGVRKRIALRRFVVRAAGPPQRKPRKQGTKAKTAARGGRKATGEQRRKVTVSIGLARAGPRDPSAAAVLERADQALYRAKRAGRNRLVSVKARC